MSRNFLEYRRQRHWLPTAVGLVLWTQAAFGAEVFFDDFDTPAQRLDGRWTTEIGPSSFLGRTQLQDWVTPGGIGTFITQDGFAELALNTYNPTGASFYGTHAKTVASFQPEADRHVELSASIRLTTLQPGIVFGLYFFGCQAGSCATHHDEIDIEILTNYLQPGAPEYRVQLNRYDAEPLGAGHGPMVSLPNGFDPLAENRWTIEWHTDHLAYRVNGVLLFEAFDHVPQNAMQANVIAWAPAVEWADAYDGSFQFTLDPASNERHVALINDLRVRVVPLPPSVLMLCAGLAGLGAAGRARKRASECQVPQPK